MENILSLAVDLRMHIDLLARERLFRMTRARLILDLVLLAIILAVAAALADALWMPGRSFAGAPPPPTSDELSIQTDLHRYIHQLAENIGERNSAKYDNLKKAAAYIEDVLKEQGLAVKRQEYRLERVPYQNIIAELPGSSKRDEIIVVGAHYDSVAGAPGANDNGSGTAATLELAKLLAHSHPARTIRFVLFTNEEPPYFGSQEMGSYHYVLDCHRAHDNIVALLDPETLGYYTDAANTQTYPSYFVPFYPRTGNFITFVGNRRSRALVEACMKTFRDTTPFPSEGVAAPEFINGVDWADQYWFWKNGYPGVMITDTALYRYPHYHTRQDTADKLNYPAFARVVGGLGRVVNYLANDWSG